MNQVTLFADFKSHSPTPCTIDIEQINFNIDAIDRYCNLNFSLKSKLEKDGVLCEILPVFQFVCIITIQNEKNGSMWFMDGDKSLDIAIDTYKALMNDEDNAESHKFLDTFLYVKDNYAKLSGGAFLTSATDDE